MNENELKQIAVSVWEKDHTIAVKWGNKDDQFVQFGSTPYRVRLQKFGGSWCAMLNGRIIYTGGFAMALEVTKNLVHALVED